MPVAIFGHIGNGNAHIVPLLNVNDRQDFDKMMQAYHEMHQTVLTRFGGSICGEHGDGRVRAEYVRKMFGEELYQLFVQVKQALRPARRHESRHQNQRGVLHRAYRLHAGCQNPAPLVRSAIRSARSTMSFNPRI